MRKIAATYVFPIISPPIKNGIIEIEDDGTILDIIDTKGKLAEQANLEYYNGILAPGFINTHCHIELSYLQKKITEQLGLPGFLGQINKLRNEEFPNKEDTIKKADEKLYQQGVVAVGDVSNSFDSIPIKRRSKITYHTFAEAFGFKPERADKAFGISKNIYGILKSNGMGASISPHSPYSVSEKLFQLIKKHAESNNSIISIHNQESRDENQFFQTGEGGIANHLKNNIGLDISGWKPTGKNSLQSILKYLPKDNQILLVHNTYTTINDLKVLKDTINSELLFLVLCPSSNLYIENALPPIQLFQKENLNICIGTDSLASNKELSMVNEMYTIQQQYPNIVLEELLKWATINGAKALQLDKTIGTLEIGKKPGINLLTGIDLHNLKFTNQSKVKRLV